MSEGGEMGGEGRDGGSKGQFEMVIIQSIPFGMTSVNA